MELGEVQLPGPGVRGKRAGEEGWVGSLKASLITRGWSESLVISGVGRGRQGRKSEASAKRFWYALSGYSLLSRISQSIQGAQEGLPTALPDCSWKHEHVAPKAQQDTVITEILLGVVFPSSIKQQIPQHQASLINDIIKHNSMFLVKS